MVEDFCLGLGQSIRAQVAVLSKRFTVNLAVESEDLDDELEEEDESEDEEDVDEDDEPRPR